MSFEERKINSQTKLECKICWWVYDPQIGDESQQIPIGVSFSELPDFWSCPICANDRDKFIIIDENTKE